MKNLLLILITSLILLAPQASAEIGYKAGWSNAKVEQQASKCIEIFNQDLCNGSEPIGTAKMICSGSALRTLCGCLSTIIASLLTHKTFKDQPLVASSTLHSSGGFERCLDDLSKSTLNTP